MQKNIYEEYQNQYSITKTLRNELIPQGRTREYIEKNGVLTEDNERADNYKKVKKLIDEYHKRFISESLKDIDIPFLEEYYALYTNSKKSDDKAEINKTTGSMRKEIVKHIKKNKNYSTLFSKELITKTMPDFLEKKEEKELVEQFNKFTTYFKNFNENRKNMYSDEEKSTAIAYRIINQNLPKFIDNMKVFDIFINSPVADEISNMESEYEGILAGKSIKELFTLNAYNTTVTNEQITLYNTIIGGVLKDNKKSKGLNEYINLYNQKNSKNKEFRKLPKFSTLFKQILADKETYSFVAEQFKDDAELIDNVKKVVDELKKEVLKKDGEGSIFGLIKNVDSYDLNKIYISNGVSITGISQSLYKDWSVIKRAIEEDYDRENIKAKRTEKYYEKRDSQIKNKKCFSIGFLNDVIGKVVEEDIPVQKYFIDFKDNKGISYYDNFLMACEAAEEIFDMEFTGKKGISGNKKVTKVIKDLLDSIKNIEQFIKPLLVNGNESDIDYSFYGELEEIYNKINVITPLYNKVRNYITKKPYSTEKIKLNFGNPDFLGGWPVKREIATSGLIFKDEKFYYLGVIVKGYGNSFKSYPLPDNENDKFYKMEYLQAADPQKDVQNLMVINGKTEKKNGRKEKEGIYEGENIQLENYKNQYLPEEINRIRKSKSYSRQDMDVFNKEDLVKFIDYYKQRVVEYFDKFEFVFKDSKEYRDFGEFTDHVNAQAYQLKFVEVSKRHIYNLVDEGKLYLFKIYNKDFSEYSKGTPNLHTIYFKMLFDEKNLANVVYKLNGEAEVFYRKASILEDNMVIHKKNEPIKNKNIDVISKKAESLFEYDLIKDKRYTVEKFQLHLPITMNFGATGTDKLNSKVLETIRNNEDIHVIGIDRGERNLIYVSVVDSNGRIVKQESMNIIKTDKEYEQDYHRLLQTKENVKKEELKNWDTVETIKELKEGYLSLVIHKIIEYMMEYNAIVVLEDLNSGFKNSRVKVEKQVYQKFEKMLIDKLNYLVDKKKDSDELGGALHAYQLTNKFESFAKINKQCGFLFYIPPWNTSKIDPTTGFVNMLHFKYKSINDAITQLSKLKRFSYNGEYFEFDVDYKDFTEKANGTRTEWTICSYGKRVKTFRNPKKNSEWDSEEVDITEEIIKLLLKYDIDVNTENLLDQIISVGEKEFYEELFKCLNLVLQIRNSITGTDVDYMISPVKNQNNEFFDTRKYNNKSHLPCDADANGAYNIARKGLWLMDYIRNSADDRVKKTISNKEWLAYAQEHTIL